MSDINEQLRASVQMDAINGTVEERMVCSSQMIDAALTIEQLRKDNTQAQAKITEYEEVLKLYGDANNYEDGVFGQWVQEFDASTMGCLGEEFHPDNGKLAREVMSDGG